MGFSGFTGLAKRFNQCSVRNLHFLSWSCLSIIGIYTRTRPPYVSHAGQTSRIESARRYSGQMSEDSRLGLTVLLLLLLINSITLFTFFFASLEINRSFRFIKVLTHL